MSTRIPKYPDGTRVRILHARVDMVGREGTIANLVGEVWPYMYAVRLDEPTWDGLKLPLLLGSELEVLNPDV
jgi:hypothetical protein